VTTIEARVCQEHAQEASFLWLLRDRAVHDPAYDLADLSALDDRLAAHLDVLRIGGEAGWIACRDLLARAEGGEVFGAALIAIDRWNLRGLARVLDVGGSAPGLARGLASALGWTPFERVKQALPGLLSPRASPALTWIGITACAVHRQDPGAPLGYAIAGKNARVRARALRAAGELGRSDLLPEIQEALRDDDEACRFWAAWSATLLGEDRAARVLWDLARGPGPFAEPAAMMAMRRIDAATACGWVQALSGGAPSARPPIAAAAAVGDPALIPWLIDAMSTAPNARFAGGALTMITGVNLEQAKLTARPPEGFQAGPTDDPADENVAMDPDESLPWPDADAVAVWWRQHGNAYPRGTRHLLGRPMSSDWLAEVLRRGGQPARAAAAIELAVRAPGRPLFEVRAPGHWQRKELSA
jgi:uncharacterized protein (TIGR02270 family)